MKKFSVAIPSIAVYQALRPVIKHRVKAAVSGGVMVFVFFHYGYAVQSIPHFELIRLPFLVIGKNTALVGITMLLLALFLYRMRCSRRDFSRYLVFMSYFSMIMIVMSLVRIAFFFVSPQTGRIPSSAI